MVNMSLIIMSAGESVRFRKNTKIKKHWLRKDSKPIWLYVADELSNKFNFKKIVITANKNELNYMKKFCEYEIIEGGPSRQESLKNALNVIDTKFVLTNDAARFNIDLNVLYNMFEQDIDNYDCIIPTIGVVDTVFLDNNNYKEYLDRDKVRLVQTPQISRVDILLKALEKGKFSDESSAINNYGGRILSIEGSKDLHKLTFCNDINYFNLDTSGETYVGYGFDVHKFISNKKMFLGGVFIDCGFGLEAHSDGDVVIHSLCDALLGAVGGGDIGELFPNNSEEFKNIDSKILLDKVVNFIHSIGFLIINVDIMIMAQIPSITPYKLKILEVLSSILCISKYNINIKATTMEKMGFIGRNEGMCVSSIVNVKYNIDI